MMAKSQARGNREAKKPKQPKKVVAPVAVAFGSTPSKTAVAGAAAKKK
jgi:hypothetical protein